MYVHKKNIVNINYDFNLNQNNFRIHIMWQFRSLIISLLCLLIALTSARGAREPWLTSAVTAGFAGVDGAEVASIEIAFR